MAETNGNETTETLRAIEDVTAFPILTEDLSSAYPSGRAATDNSLSSTAAIGRIVQTALGNVLNWKPRDGEPKAFLSALTRSYDLFDVEGHTVARYVANRYAVDADLGAVTGAQASIYARATAFLAQCAPLLRSLLPLRPDFDLQDMDAIRSIVESGVGELVSELGQQGGPRLARVDQLFFLLLGGHEDPHQSENIGGQLGLLRERFGLSRQYVNTISEEEGLTNYLILVDGVRALYHTWTTQRQFFDRGGKNVFLGTQAVLLSRSLGVIAEAVGDAYTVMDSVFLGPAERQVARLQLKGGGNIFLSELLDWVNEFATSEGPRLVRDGGKDGVIYAFLPTVKKLADLTREAADFAARVPTPHVRQRHAATTAVGQAAPAAGATAPPVGGGGGAIRPSSSLGTPRVIRALDALATQCENARRLASQLRRTVPQLTSINQTSVPADAPFELVIDGSDIPQTPDLQISLHYDPIVHPPGVTIPCVVIPAHTATAITSAQIVAKFAVRDVTTALKSLTSLKVPDVHASQWTVVLYDPDTGADDTKLRPQRLTIVQPDTDDTLHDPPGEKPDGPPRETPGGTGGKNPDLPWQPNSPTGLAQRPTPGQRVIAVRQAAAAPRATPKLTAVHPDYAYAGDLAVPILCVGEGLDAEVDLAFGNALLATIDHAKPRSPGALWVTLDLPAQTPAPGVVTTLLRSNGFPNAGPAFQIKQLPSIASVRVDPDAAGLTLHVTGNDLLDATDVYLKVVTFDEQGGQVPKAMRAGIPPAQRGAARDATALPPVTVTGLRPSDANVPASAVESAVVTVAVANPDGRGSEPYILSGTQRDEVVRRLFPPRGKRGQQQ